MTPQIESAEELITWFFNVNKGNKGNQAIRSIYKGIYITTKVRRDLMCNERQGKIQINGRVEHIKFTNMGGGVYHAYIEELGKLK